MRIRLGSMATALALLVPLVANAETIAVVAPSSGPYAALGNQILVGARAAAEATGHEVLALDEPCEAEADTNTVTRMREAGAVAAVGFLCTETLSRLMPELAEAGIPAITVAVRSDLLMEDALRHNWPLFRMAPGEEAEAEAISAAVLDRWKAEPVAIIDDGTIYGRELASAVRGALEQGGITPVFVDTYRPGQEQQVALVRRLAKAGATHVVVGGDRNDVAVIARDAGAERIPLTILAGDTMRAANRPVPLKDGVLAAALPDYAGFPAAADVAATLRAGHGEPEGYTLPAYAAVQIVAASLSEDDDKPLATRLLDGDFHTVIGPLAFDARQELAANPLRLQEWRGGGFHILAPSTQ